MKIGVNGRFLAKPYTGIGQHTKYLFDAIARLHPEISIVMAVHEKVSVPLPKNVEIHVLPEKFPGTGGMKKTYWEQRQVPQFFQSQEVDLAHFPYPSNPWSGFSKPVCVTVHDVIPWENAAYRRSITTRMYQDSCRFAVKKADRIFTVSEASKYDIVPMCHVEEERIVLTYNAPAPQFSRKIDESGRAKILQKYGLDPGRRYFLYVGGYDERKNVPALVEAFERFISPHHEIDLVLSGGKAVNDPLYASFDHLLHRDQSQRPGKIHTTGFIDEADLPALYQSAFVFVNVSTKEGCNLPLLEALVSGIPVIASDIPVHHEMIGPHAVYVKPNDIERIGALMDQLLRDDNFYSLHHKDAIDYRCPFSWDKTAGKVFGEYEELIRLKSML